MKIQSYPNDFNNIPHRKSYDINKWVTAFRDFYRKTIAGLERQKALDLVCSGWEKMEKKDFDNWIKYYQGSNHTKYSFDLNILNVKNGQLSYYVNDGMPGYIIPFKSEQKEPEIQNVSDVVTHEEIESQKREIIELQRSKFLSRLNSAEKLLTEEAGHLLAGPELHRFLEILHALKRDIISVNKKSSSNNTYIDLIYRQSNILSSKGFVKEAALIEKLAQAADTSKLDSSKPETKDSGKALTPTPALAGPSTPATTDETKNSDISKLKDDENTLVPSEDSKPEDGKVPGPIEVGKPSKLDGFLQNLNPVQKAETFSADDDFTIVLEGDPFSEIEDDNNLMITEAQLQPPKTPQAPELEVTESDIPALSESHQEPKDFDYLIDVAFKNLKVEDVVKKLEDVAKIFKTREISRQLSICDLMLTQLNMSSIFPNLGEAINKSLESNQYCLTRIEDILSALRGALKTEDISLTTEPSPVTDPNAEAVKRTLEDQKIKEKQRKDMRKTLENQELENKLTKEAPVVENVSQELQPTLPPVK